MKYLALAVFLAFPVAAAAQAEPTSIAECERIKGDLAYNQCLATFGPKVGERRRAPAAPAAIGASEKQPAVQQRGGRGSRYAYRRGRGGRQSASFQVGGRKVQAASRSSIRAKRSSGKRSYRRRR